MVNINGQIPTQNKINNYKEKVITYYDVVTKHYRKYWGDFFHPAFFKNDSDDLNVALLKTHQLFLRDSKLHTSNKAIDLGCGIGSLSFFIAENIGCEVTGINFSDFQLRVARKLANEKQIRNVVFKNMDIMELNNLKEKFDAAFLIDVGCHLPDKERAIRNIFGILKRNGRLIIADWLQKKSLNPFEKELLIKPLNEFWNFPYMESIEGYKIIFKRIGFKIIKAEDVSTLTKKNWDMFYNAALSGIKKMTFRKLAPYTLSSIIKNLNFSSPRRNIQIIKNQLYANIFTKLCYDAGVFRYGYFVLEK